jgi:thiosulfate/3-mercaptopyruvate sulfurtransferase
LAGVGADTHVVIYDQGEEHDAPAASVWASRLWWQFRYEGFDRVSVLDGGLRHWAASGLPTRPCIERAAPASFTGRRREWLIASKQDVLGFIDDPSLLIIDSRAPEAYAGAADRPYRSGHIPSAVNLYSRSHIDASTGLLRPAAELDAALRSVGALDGTRTPVVYCGGGVSATWNALALAVVGGPDAVVYDGSMLEWGADETTPLEQDVPVP